MQITFTKGQTEDSITAIRADGSRAETRFPKKGPVPHDAVHLFVERGFALEHGFWGMVAAGHHPEELGALAKAAGHASASRAEQPGAEIVQLIQAERLVECFEADLWSGGGDETTLRDIARTACGYSHVPMPQIAADGIAAIRAELGTFARNWMAAPVGYIATMQWKD